MKRRWQDRGPVNPYRLMLPSQKQLARAARGGVDTCNRRAVDEFLQSEEKNDA